MGAVEKLTPFGGWRFWMSGVRVFYAYFRAGDDEAPYPLGRRRCAVMAVKQAWRRPASLPVKGEC